MSTVKFEFGVKALGFVTVPVHVSFVAVEMHAATAAVLPMTRLSATAEMK